MTEEPLKISVLEFSNFKRLKALRAEVNESGFTIFGGKNAQGKTSVLNGIAFALGGKKLMPGSVDSLKREGAVGGTVLRIETTNGLVIERKGKNLDLVVTDSTGARYGQQLLDGFLSEFAINLPKFHNAPSKDKAKILLQAVKLGDETAAQLNIPKGKTLEEVIAALDRDEKSKRDTRTVIGRQADQKEKAAKDMEWFEDAPDAEVSPTELLAQQQEILRRNAEKAAAKRRLDSDTYTRDTQNRQIAQLEAQIVALRESVAALDKSIADAENTDFAPEPTDELERQIADFEATNRKVRANAEREAKIAEADTLRDQYDALTKEIADIDKRRAEILENANLPLPGLSVKDGELLFNGKPWQNMSGAEQVIVDVAIASSLKPECRLVLLDELEKLDLDSLKEAQEWLTVHDMQCIAVRVSSNADGECSFVIEDGELAEPVKVTSVSEVADFPEY